MNSVFKNLSQALKKLAILKRRSEAIYRADGVMEPDIEVEGGEMTVVLENEGSTREPEALLVSLVADTLAHRP